MKQNTLIKKILEKQRLEYKERAIAFLEGKVEAYELILKIRGGILNRE